MNINDKLKAFDITLPPVAVPAAAYVPFVQTGKLVFLSGHIARKDGKPWVGQLGKNVTTPKARPQRARWRSTSWARCRPPARLPVAISTASSAS
jgi:hypothetical protein